MSEIIHEKLHWIALLAILAATIFFVGGTGEGDQAKL
jgi:hypothetical protein